MIRQERALAGALFQRAFGRAAPNGLRPFDLHPKQAQFVYAEQHHAAFVGGIGSGKTYAGCARALRASYGQVGNTAVVTPNLGVITAPTYPMLRDATLRTWMALAETHVPGFDPSMLNRSMMTAKLPNGSEVLFRSTEHPDRLRGPSITWWLADEAALYTPAVRPIMIGRLRQHGRLGYEFSATTPRGKNWVWKTFAQHERDGYLLVQATSRDNVFLSDTLLEMWEREYTGDFARQELAGEFVAFEGMIYANFDRQKHVSRQRPDQFDRVIAGVDWGFANPGVIVVIGVDGDNRVWVLAEAYERRRRVEEWVSVAAQMRDLWGIRQFVCDPSEPDYIRLFRDGGLNAEGADNRVLPGIQMVQNLLPMGQDGRARLTVAPDCVNLLAEIEQYQWAENKAGLRDQPVKANDHAMDALRYAVVAAVKPPRFALLTDF